MKKTNLTTAVVAGLVGAAGLVNVSNAVNLNPDGVGQVLLYPYYTVNDGLATLVSVVNTTNETKAVKVRFLESRNSQEVFDFNLYLSPFDVWTGAIVERDEADNAGGAIPVSQLGETGPAWIFTGDNSCTVPSFHTVGTFAGMQDVRFDNFFKNFQYATDGNNPDVGGDSLSRTRTGHIEMIEMGADVQDNIVVDSVSGNNYVSGDAFSGASGFSTIIQNSGNHVVIQNATIVNLSVGK